MIAEQAYAMEKLHSILFVEDDRSLRKSVGEFLNDHGYLFHSVGTMNEAWQMMLDVLPAVCILDLNLPDGSGLDLLNQIVQANLPTRVIVMTAFPLSHLQTRFPAGVLVEWLTKPVGPADLLTAVEKALKTTS